MALYTLTLACLTATDDKCKYGRVRCVCDGAHIMTLTPITSHMGDRGGSSHRRPIWSLLVHSPVRKVIPLKKVIRPKDAVTCQRLLWGWVCLAHSRVLRAANNGTRVTCLTCREAHWPLVSNVQFQLKVYGPPHIQLPPLTYDSWHFYCVFCLTLDRHVPF